MANILISLRRVVPIVLAGAALTMLSGCGGGGGGSLGGLNMFISDDLDTGYDQVWVTVHQLEVQQAGGAYRTVFTDAAGVQVNLSALNDGAPKFLYLGTRAVPVGDYSGVRVTMGRNLTLVPTGASTGDACTFDPAFDFGVNQTRVTFGFAANVAVAANDSMVVDFDLANWTRAGNLVTPAFKEGDDSTLGDLGRHEDEDYHGIVAKLTGTAPNQTFVLSRATGSFEVATDTGTIIFEEDSSGSPVLANDQRVEVRGVFDATSGVLRARVIKIEDSNLDDEDKVEGPTSNLDELAMTVDVAVREAEGFMPPGPVVHVQFGTGTRFFTKAGAPLTLSEMLVFLAAGAEVEAEGVYDAGSNTVAAAKIKLHPEDEHEAEVKGAVSNINAIAGTFDVTLGMWFGFSGSIGQIVPIVTTGETAFQDDDGNPMTSAEFFAALQVGSFAEVEGVFENGTITAETAELEDGPGEPEAKGYVAAWNLGTGQFTLNLIEWFGFDGSFGAPQVVQTTGLTEYEDLDGNPLTQAEFFGGLAVGMVAEARGTYAGGVLTASRARYKD